MFSVLQTPTDNQECVKLELLTGDIHTGVKLRYGCKLKWLGAELVNLQYISTFTNFNSNELPLRATVHSGGHELYDVEIAAIAPVTAIARDIYAADLKISAFGTGKLFSHVFPTIKRLTGIYKPMICPGDDIVVEFERNPISTPLEHFVVATLKRVVDYKTIPFFGIHTHKYHFGAKIRQIRLHVVDMNTSGLLALYVYLLDNNNALIYDSGKLSGEMVIKLGNEDIIRHSSPKDLMFNAFNAKKKTVDAYTEGTYVGPSIFKNKIIECRSDSGSALAMEFSKTETELNMIILTLTTSPNTL